jgi:hypothetical protein
MRRVMLAVMSLGAAVAHAAGSWYLVVPPRSDYDERAPFLAGYTIQQERPLAEWQLTGIFASTLKCMARRDALVLSEHKQYFADLGAYMKDERQGSEPELLRYGRFTAELHNANYAAYSASRFVPADDPELRLTR